MHAALHQAAFHPLTPGSPAYAIAKLSAVGGLIGLRVALSRRARRNAESENNPEPAEQRPAKPHPVSSRKARRRSHRRR